MTLNLAAVLNGTLAEVYSPAGQRLSLTRADLERSITDVVIDSRNCTDGSLFVALPGEKMDGHRFVAQAIGRGARGALIKQSRVAEVTATNAGGTTTETYQYLLAVADPLTALQRLAAYWRRRHKTQVVGITGSIGKTTTKEITAGVLSDAFKVLRSAANLNTEIGVPLTLLRLHSQHDVAVLEMAMYLPGDIALLAELAGPAIGVVTNVAPVHLERLGSIERIARAKSELVAALGVEDLAILNADDRWTRAMAKSTAICRTLLVGRADDADYRAFDLEPRGLDGYSFSMVAEGEQRSFHTHVPGTHTLHAFLTALAVGRALEVSWEELAEQVAAVRLDARQRILHPSPTHTIIDDAYNAAPQSVSAALRLLVEAPGTKVAVLGDMLELGAEEESSHREVGRLSAQTTDWLVVRGPRSRWIAEEAERAGLRSDRIIRVDDNQGAVEAAREILSGASDGAQWSILVKGSRGMKMEEVVQALEHMA